ncbi:MAG: hypothetical protein IIA77_04945 [Proteobacteria bacterium]|nr:hypothetical protein [Pseudomonadota bacterium]
MSISKTFFYTSIFICLGLSQFGYTSSTMSEDKVSNVNRVDTTNEKEQELLSKAAGLLADYEIAAKKLLTTLKNETSKAEEISDQAKELLLLSEEVINSTRFRLPQCDEYLTKTMVLKNSLKTISHESLEKDYHHDGALPKAPAECYHTKDLFIHPATVIILTRDDPSLNDTTKSSINAEISEVLGHTELVRQLVIY